MARTDFHNEGYWVEMARRARYKSNLLSTATGISQRQMRRYIKLIFGCSPHLWLNDQRLKLARTLLVKNRCAKVVCYDLGFKQPSHFSRQFKQHYGLSPSEFLELDHATKGKNEGENHMQIQLNFSFMSRLDKHGRSR